MKPKLLLALAASLVMASCGAAPEPERPDAAAGAPQSPAAVDPAAVDSAATQEPARRLREFPDLGGNFALTDHHGDTFRLSDTDGQVRLLFFGYASCPDVCPLTLSKITRVRGMLGEDADQLVTLFVSVDPERDDAARLAEYLGYFDLGDAIALTGSPAEIDAVLESFSARFEKVDKGSTAGYLIDHTSYIYLIDRQGTVRAIFRHSELPEEIAAAIRLLVAEKGS